MIGSIGVTFDGFDLSTVAYVPNDIQHDAPAKRTLYTQSSARADGNKLTGSFFNEKIIRITGQIIGTSIANCRALIDAMNLAVSAQEAQLDITEDGVTRRYIATCSTPVVTREATGVTAQCDLEFTVSSGVGVDISSSNFISSPATITTSGVNTSVSPIGSSLDQLPILTLVLNSGTGLTSKTISVQNPATGVTISVTRTWVAADMLVINPNTYEVTVNGSAVNYSGYFPSWTPGPGSVRTSDNLTTRDITLSGVYTPRYR